MRGWINSFDQVLPFVSSMLILRGALCLSEHIEPLQGPTFLHFLHFASVLDPAPVPAHSMNLMLLYAEAYQAKPSPTPSDQSQSEVWIMRLSCPRNCLISREYNCYQVSGMKFYCFYWLGLQTFGVFWGVHKSKRLAPASFPLGARRRGNLLKLHASVVTSCFNGVRLTGTASFRQIISVISLVLLVFHIHPSDRDKGKVFNIRRGSESWGWFLFFFFFFFQLNLENQRKHCVLHIANGFHSAPISVFVSEQRFYMYCTLTSGHVCSIWVLVWFLGDWSYSRDGENDMDSSMSSHNFFFFFFSYYNYFILIAWGNSVCHF